MIFGNIFRSQFLYHIVFIWKITDYLFEIFLIDWKQLKDIFGEYGEVAFTRVVSDRETKRSKGFGFVEFVNAADAAKAKEALDGAEVDGRAIRVDFATEKQENN